MRLRRGIRHVDLSEKVVLPHSKHYSPVPFARQSLMEKSAEQKIDVASEYLQGAALDALCQPKYMVVHPLTEGFGGVKRGENGGETKAAKWVVWVAEDEGERGHRKPDLYQIGDGKMDGDELCDAAREIDPVCGAVVKAC